MCTVYQLALLWEAAFSYSDIFLKTLSTRLPISWWVIDERTCPQCTECSVIFDTKWHDPHALPSLFIWSHPEWLLFCFLEEKSPQMQMFCQCGRGETKNGRSTKRHQNWCVQKLFLNSGKNVLKGVLHQMESTLKVTEVETCKNKYIFFINKFWVVLGLPCRSQSCKYSLSTSFPMLFS